ncbi:MAG TPA: HAMP domain-containing sensor histidine kinase [Fimbriimonas sp.]|nr:HAMP domain-containing sensor histidine kinase [Fimbriimonas sp.]
MQPPKQLWTAPWVRYGSAVVAVLLVLALRESLSDTLGERSRHILFVPVVLLSALYAGTGPGIVALLLSAGLSVPFYHGSLAALEVGDQVALLIYLALGSGILFLTSRERLHKRLRQEAEENLAALNSELEQRVKSRTAQLEAANRELDQFCYSVAHDLRTPMRAIAGNARILLEDHDPELGDDVRQKLVRMENAATKLGELVEGLLIYARLANQDITPEMVDVREMLQDAAKLFGKEEKCEVRLDMADELRLEADPKMMRVAINALMKNALRYRKPGEAAILHVSKDGQTLIFRDEGIGFEMQYVDKIFEPFERLHRDEAYPGVGMGLAFVKRVMERHGGSVTATAVPGNGTEIRLQF